MALHTAAGFVALGSGLLAALHPREAPGGPSHRRARRAPARPRRRRDRDRELRHHRRGGPGNARTGSELRAPVPDHHHHDQCRAAHGSRRDHHQPPEPLEALAGARIRSGQRRGAHGGADRSAESFLPHEFLRDRHHPAHGRRGREGRWLRHRAGDSRSTLAGAGEGSLLWRDGVFLRHRLPLADAKGRSAPCSPSNRSRN